MAERGVVVGLPTASAQADELGVRALVEGSDNATQGRPAIVINDEHPSRGGTKVRRCPSRPCFARRDWCWREGRRSRARKSLREGRAPGAVLALIPSKSLEEVSSCEDREQALVLTAKPISAEVVSGIHAYDCGRYDQRKGRSPPRYHPAVVRLPPAALAS